MDKLNLQLLGEFGLQSQEGLCIKVSSKKSRALVGYLASRPGRPVSRVDLARMLWERHDEQQALTNLRQTLSVLNNQLCSICPQWMIKDSGFISLDADLFASDIDQVQAISHSADRASLEIAAELFRGRFLEGLNFHEESLNRWLDGERQKYEIRHIEIRKQLLERQIETEDYASAASNAERLVLLDPIDEQNHRRLMSIYSSLGQRHRILRQYQQCCQALEYHQIGQPEDKTVSLFQSLYYDTVIHSVFEASPANQAESTGSTQDSGTIPAIAVLPFHDLMDKPDSLALSTALTEEVVNELRRFHGFKVISALSSMSVGGQNFDLKTVSRMLGARYLVSGSIRQSRQQVQIAVELVDAENGELIWAERYARKIEELFILQAELARDIAGEIEPEAVGHAYLLSTRKPPNSMTAWDLVLRGDHSLYKQLGTRCNSNEAQRLYRKAMELDPDYAPSYAGLAYSLCLELKESIAEDVKCVENSMREMAEQAVRLDENNPWCLVILGRAQQQLKEYDAAVMTYRKAVALCPSSSRAHFGLGFGLSATSQYDEAITAMDRAIELSPRDPMSWSYHTVKALTYIYSEQFDLAASSSAISSNYPAANHWAPAIQVPSLVHLGRYDDALKVLENARKSKPGISVHSVENAFSTKNSMDALSLREGLIEAGLPEQ
ncbi:MAG: BTAD domain-containing putative transcriptional regulator [Gammaproteobacteria bacterium]